MRLQGTRAGNSGHGAHASIGLPRRPACALGKRARIGLQRAAADRAQPHRHERPRRPALAAGLCTDRSSACRHGPVLAHQATTLVTEAARIRHITYTLYRYAAFRVRRMTRRGKAAAVGRPMPEGAVAVPGYARAAAGRPGRRLPGTDAMGRVPPIAEPDPDALHRHAGCAFPRRTPHAPVPTPESRSPSNRPT